MPAHCNVLMIYPRFSAGSFWNYTVTSELLGARYPTIPLGLITLAAMLPAHWKIRLVNRNTETLGEGDLEWADLVMTGGMLFQQADSLRLIGCAHAHGKPIAIGGPDATSSPHIYAAADFRVLGEAEGIIDKFVAACEAGERAGDFEAPKFQVDVEKVADPAFRSAQVRRLSVHRRAVLPRLSFTCEFCDIIELYGRVPRTKTAPQMLAELDALYAPRLSRPCRFRRRQSHRQQEGGAGVPPDSKRGRRRTTFHSSSPPRPRSISPTTQSCSSDAGVRFLRDLRRDREPRPATLVAMKKKQNTRRSLTESVQKIYDAGMLVTAGFIIGFDSETGSIARPMADFIEDAASRWRWWGCSPRCPIRS